MQQIHVDSAEHRYPKYMETEKVREMQAVVWKETVYILSQVSSGAQAFFTRLSQDSVN